MYVALGEIIWSISQHRRHVSSWTYASGYYTSLCSANDSIVYQLKIFTRSKLYPRRANHFKVSTSTERVFFHKFWVGKRHILFKGVKDIYEVYL